MVSPSPEVDVPILESDAGEQLYTGLTGVAGREGLQVERVPNWLAR